MVRLPQLPPYLNITPKHFDPTLFTNLNDMDAHFLEFERLKQIKELRCELIDEDMSIYRNATIDLYEPFFQSISFFTIDDQDRLRSLVTYANCTEDSDKQNRTFRYSMGYAVAPQWRGHGLGLQTVRESLTYLRHFLHSIGPQRDGELYEGFRFMVDVVIDVDNQPSQELAKHIRPTNSELQFSEERLTRKPVSYFSIELPD